MLGFDQLFLFLTPRGGQENKLHSKGFVKVTVSLKSRNI